MESNTREWIAVGLFFVAFFAFTFGEVFYLSRGESNRLGRSFMFAFVSNILSVSVGFFVSFLIFGVVMMLVFDGSIQSMPTGEYGIATALIIAAIFPPILLIFGKAIAFRLLKIDFVERKWLYSIVVSIAFFMVVSALPFLFIYLT